MKRDARLYAALVYEPKDPHRLVGRRAELRRQRVARALCGGRQTHREDEIVVEAGLLDDLLDFLGAIRRIEANAMVSARDANGGPRLGGIIEELPGRLPEQFAYEL